MKLLSTISLLVISLAAYTYVSAKSEQLYAAQNTGDTTAATAPAGRLVVAELFTSQGCSSCPPAERLFSELAERDDLITLEWHVDYWDKLVHHGSKWKDRYSKKQFTERQRSYNQSLRGQRGVYTPQAIVNGHFEGVGSRPADISNMLESTAALPVDLQIVNDTVIIGPNDKAADILFVRLLKQHETDVKGGENKGRKLHGRNIVLEATVIGQVSEKSTKLTLPSVGKGETCAVLIQTLGAEVGPVLGAAKCA